MIKTIIKRDGSKEPFSPHKINGWGEWASDTLGDLVDWSDVILQTVSKLGEKTKSVDLQKALISTCLGMDTWSYNMMAGRLFNNLYRKDLYGSLEMPTVKSVQKSLQDAGLMRDLGYSDEEYEQIEQMIDHTRDFKKPYFALQFIRAVYAMRKRVDGEGVGREYETPQFVYMRMAMDLAMDQPNDRKMTDLKIWYDMLSLHKGSAPTGNFNNLGSFNFGLAACCAMISDDNLMSLSIADHIATVMTGQSAGIGDKKVTRSLGEGVRNGSIKHQGTVPYYKILEACVHGNKQGSRGGAATSHIEIYDPDIEVKLALRNPMSTEDNKVDRIDYSYQYNRHFARKVAKNEEVFLFTKHSAPDLWESLFFNDLGETFVKLYEKYEQDSSFKKTYLNARDLLVSWQSEAFESNRAYEMNLDEVNYHTPHKDKIYSSNLCQELSVPTKWYHNMMDLYSSEAHDRGEVAICTIGAINVAEIESDEEYLLIAKYELLMADKCIHKSHYPLTHVGVTAKARINAGIGIIGLAELMAKEGLSFTSPEGLERLDEIYERHSYFLIKASLELGKELGNAPWMHKTKWPEGWLPIDTYNKNVDSIVPFKTRYDWEGLRQEIIENGGIRNSSLVMHMPSESSSKAIGTTSGVYPIRDNSLNRTSGQTAIYWSAPNSDSIQYESVWNMTLNEQVNNYAIGQKWCDQTISADLFKYIPLGTKVESRETIAAFLYRVKMGLKNRYYMNTTDEMPDICANCSV